MEYAHACIVCRRVTHDKHMAAADMTVRHMLQGTLMKTACLGGKYAIMSHVLI